MSLDFLKKEKYLPEKKKLYSSSYSPGREGVK